MGAELRQGSSLAGQVGQINYSSAKAAVLNLTSFLAREWAPKGVRVNSITPGFFPAEQNRKVLTPVFEDTALFARTSGQGSDVVQKEMYTFEDRDGGSLTLRPEATGPPLAARYEVVVVPSASRRTIDWRPTPKGP